MTFCACRIFLTCDRNSGINRSAAESSRESLGIVFPKRNSVFSLVMTWLKHLNQYSTATSMAAISKPYSSASSVTGFPFKKKSGVTPLWENSGLVPATSANSGR